ncbi:MAG: VWA domain-containing protein [Bacteroidales bacterium]|nr:VWA domain-containing protein [Bacteroidales bacterium]
MKTMNKKSKTLAGLYRILPALPVILVAGAIMLLSTCKKDEDNSDKAFKSMNDDSTTAIDVTIPRIELGLGRSTTITVFLSVTDQNGNPFKEFNQYNFNIKQVCDGYTDTAVIASITFTKAQAEGYNTAAAMTMDYSGSMGGANKKNMEKAAKQFVYLKEDQDYCEIIKFDESYEVTLPFSTDIDLLLAAIDSDYGGGSTAFYDATFKGIQDAADFVLSNFGLIPSVLAFTDGKENSSTLADLPFCITMSQKEQVPVFTIGYGNVDSLDLQQLAEETGGRYFYTPDSEGLTALYSLISGQLENLYMLTWEYDNPACEKVWVLVTATYTCANGTFTAKNEKYVFTAKK